MLLISVLLLISSTYINNVWNIISNTLRNVLGHSDDQLNLGRDLRPGGGGGSVEAATQ